MLRWPGPGGGGRRVALPTLKQPKSIKNALAPYLWLAPQYRGVKVNARRLAGLLSYTGLIVSGASSILVRVEGHANA